MSLDKLFRRFLKVDQRVDPALLSQWDDQQNPLHRPQVRLGGHLRSNR